MAKSVRELVLRDRLRFLERLLEQTRRQLKAYEVQQPELPGTPAAPASPPRKLSQQQEDLVEFQEARAGRLEELGVDVTPDEQHEVAFVNARLGTIRKACGDDTATLHELFDAYFDSDTPARYTPPYSFNAFASDKWWRALLADLKRTPGAPRT